MPTFTDKDGKIVHTNAYAMTKNEREMWRIDRGLIPLKNTPIKNTRYKSRKPVKKRKDPYVKVTAPHNQKKYSVIMRLYDISEDKRFSKYQFEYRPNRYLYITRVRGKWVGTVDNTDLWVSAQDKTMCLAKLLGENWYNDGNRWHSAHDMHRHLHFVWSADHNRTLPQKNLLEYFDCREGMTIVSGGN